MTDERRIPATMSTQHPDNVASPNWAKDEVLAGDMEVEETYRAFSEFGCQEQMWDWEAKDADPNVVRKLVAYPAFFKKHRLGRGIFLTIRVANPNVEKAEQKALIEALTSIPRSYDVASNFYSAEDVPPIFEVILPMTTSAAELSRVASLYETLIAHKTDAGDFDDTISAADWIGEFKPKHIEVIPLLENFESIFHADQIISDYVRKRKLSHVRVFLARSDPALNYGMIPAVLLIKVALAKLSKLSESAGTVAEEASSTDVTRYIVESGRLRFSLG